ncbi:hypothetical protein [Archangium primigenium]|uniref:hypothetical protein n=1 Tax=[Archangium] primigenium TaxID=2792470 RepID=UPI00195D758A|nr:hypothetical protein [Archangium primigenium]MBM7113418.1 hypothetical protein [Archangium primigenium]
MMFAGVLTALLAADPTASIPGTEGEPARVERRLLLKRHHVFTTAGLGYLSRGDYYSNPGLMASASWYPVESGGVELKLGLFVSSLGAAGTEVFERTGLVPDAHRPVALLAAGWRQTLGYGKALVGEGTLVHFDLQLAGHMGFVFTDRGVSPSPMGGPGVLMRMGPRFHAQLDVPLVLSFESRSRGLLSLGVLPTLTLGVVL